MMRGILHLKIAFFGAVLLTASGVEGQAPPVGPSLPSRESANGNRTRVWTNDDVEWLRENVSISIVGSVGDERSEKAKVVERPYAREQDPAWYREQLVPLEAELSKIDDRIDELEKYRSITRYMVGGVIVPQLAGLPLNPEGQIRQLSEKRREVMRDIAALQDLARRNEILPGGIR